VPRFATLTVSVPVSPVKKEPGLTVVLSMATCDPDPALVLAALVPVLVPVLVSVLVLVVGTAVISAAANGATTAQRSRQRMPAPSAGQCLGRCGFTSASAVSGLRQRSALV
jgi:hypothetical protein